MTKHHTVLTLQQVVLSDREHAESRLECIATHTHEGCAGFLFKILTSEQPLFIDNDRILAPKPVVGSLYRYKGYAADSQVIGLEKI